jgi:hypothetical protein
MTAEFSPSGEMSNVTRFAQMEAVPIGKRGIPFVDAARCNPAGPPSLPQDAVRFDNHIHYQPASHSDSPLHVLLLTCARVDARMPRTGPQNACTCAYKSPTLY